MADDVRQQLQELCEGHGLRRFSAGEMEELLEDGEEVGWIVEQVLDDPAADPGPRLRELLSSLQAQVAPPAGSAAESPLPGPAEATAAAPSPAGGPMAALSAQGLDLDSLDLPPGVDASQLEQVMASPRGALLADFGAYCQERGFSQEDGAGPGAEEALRQLHAEWLATPRETLEGKRPAELLEGGGLFPGKVETYRRDAPKVGRNDPCPCGSGRKYKKCCGRSAQGAPPDTLPSQDRP